MAKIEYDESTNEQERVNTLREDLKKLNNIEFLISEYRLIHKRLIKHKGMTSLDAHALATCELIKKNNVHLQTLLEGWIGRKFPD